MDRRQLLKGAAGTALLLAAPGARAQAYPTRTVRIIVGYGAGGNGDVTMRIIAQKLSERMGQQFVVENRPGPGGILAGQAVTQAAPDGYTLTLAAAGNFAMTPGLFKTVPFDTAKDFAPVSLAGRFGFIFAVGSSSKIRSIPDLIAYAKANPGKLNLGTISIGTAQHIGAEMFKAMSGIDIVIIPYKNSGEVLTAARSGHIQVALETFQTLAPHFEAGALRPIGVTDPERSPLLPEVPTVAEGGVAGYDVVSWNGMAASKGTPPEILDALNREIRSVLELPDVKEKFRGLGMVAGGSSRQEFADLIVRDIERWGKAIEAANIPKQ